MALQHKKKVKHVCEERKIHGVFVLNLYSTSVGQAKAQLLIIKKPEHVHTKLLIMEVL